MTTTLLAVRGIENTSVDFRRGLLSMVDRIGGNPDYWLAVMSFETGGTFDPAVRNPVSGAVGLIQFTRGTAELLGTSTDALANMSQVEQLQWVEKYLAPAAGRFETLSDHYMAVFAPIGIGKEPGFGLYRDPSRAYRQNAPLDTNQDDVITVGEATSKVEAIVEAALERPRVEVPSEVGEAATASAGAELFALILFILGIRRFKKLGRTKT